MNVEEQRARWAKNDAIRDKDNVFPKDLVVYKDLAYGDVERWNLLDIYTPNTKMDKYPTILSIHGGGWFYGDKELYRFYTASLATRGFAVINMNYELSPEAKYPTQLKEIFMAIDYCVKNKDKFHLDMDNFFIIGDSAGAQLNHQVTTIITNPEYRKLFDFDYNLDFKLRAVGLNCGVYMLPLTIFGPISMIKDYLPKNYKDYKETYKISKYMTKDFPPTFILSGKDDFLKMFLKPMTKTLKKHGVETISKIYGIGSDIKCPHVFFEDMNNPIGKLANDEECEFFKKHIK